MMIGVCSMVTFLYLVVYNDQGTLQTFLQSLHLGYLFTATTKTFVYFLLSGVHNTS